MLYRFEANNGFGYRKRSVATPYLWSYSDHYDKGKFVADGKYNPDAVSKQVGAAILLKELM
jgi:lysozyme family protein